MRSLKYHGIVMNKNDILELRADSTENGNCKEYSTFDISKGWCTFKFYCKGEICANEVDGFVELPEGNSTKKYIPNVCQPDQLENCSAGNKCTMDSDCLSNKCFNSTCIANEKSPVIMCTDNYLYNTFLGSSSKTVCGLSNGEKCSKDSDCASGKCGDDKLCERKHSHRSADDIQTTLVYIFLSIVFLLFLFIGCCCCTHCCGICERKRNIETSKV
ncbi:hypothetical protein PIROE2DRAFT_8217 [Piromyces sp. E2]|nr:hypothetical protein PIROE2DRAFT_8217 [Piromyces sp. E2]|eukprot:OUM64907.1 hypothetical protein PIROE2DRAFT_8217 [Piromyces sp. E2]